MNLIGKNGVGVQLSSPWIEEDSISKWYKDCISSHGENCSSPPYLQLLPLSKPEYFIDVIDKRLVRAPTKNVPYAALSYVWGNISMTRTTSVNLLDFQRPGAFADSSASHKLPNTVRHAMYLTSVLNSLRYLWVDALCIIQDNNEIIYQHLSQMGSIYARASIVIASIDGIDANYGLHGPKSAPDAQYRQIHQSMISYRKKSFVCRYPIRQKFRKSDHYRHYLDRGWTFQEDFLSRRCLYFENDSVWFQCCSSTRYEDHKRPESLTKDLDWTLKVGYPSITAYSEVVNEFNKRQLRFPQDCSLAFAGTLPFYGEVFMDGFICGLPEMFFDAMLLWQPRGKLIRREADDRATIIDSEHDSCLPSWSWVGWQGSLDFHGWNTANDFIANAAGG
jgi:hypothetical protein